MLNRFVFKIFLGFSTGIKGENNIFFQENSNNKNTTQSINSE